MERDENRERKVEQMTYKLYKYRLINEHPFTGERAKRSRIMYRYEPLTIGGLYCHLGLGFPGFYRVLELVAVEELED